MLENNSIRLQKAIAIAGVASRRAAEDLIKSGKVKVNGQIATIGQKVNASDAIAVNGRLLKKKVEFERRVIIYNKPEGEICTKDDPKKRPTVFAKLPKLESGRWINIGRLDINTSGLLLFTNCGELAHKLMHPSSNIDREYAVRIFGRVTDEMLANLKNGILLEGETKEARFTDIQKAPEGEGSNHWYHCVVMEGRNREVRRLWESQEGISVNRLKRVRFGPVFLTSALKVGWLREMTKDEVKILCHEVGL